MSFACSIDDLLKILNRASLHLKLKINDDASKLSASCFSAVSAEKFVFRFFKSL